MKLFQKGTSWAFFWHEVEEEFRERDLQWIFRGSDNDALENALEEIEDLRQGELYTHHEESCSELCKAKGNNFFGYNVVLLKVPLLRLLSFIFRYQYLLQRYFLPPSRNATGLYICI